MRLASTRKPRKARPAASYAPHDAAVLAIDTAQCSGWAIYLHGDLVSRGEIDMLTPTGLSEANDVCLLALSYSAPGVLVFERPFRGTSQGGYIGAWRSAWVAAGGRKRAQIGVYPATWRARVLGSPCMTREAARAAEQRRALKETLGMPVGPDEAAAVCIGLWAIRAGEVGAVLPKRPLKRVG